MQYRGGGSQNNEFARQAARMQRKVEQARTVIKDTEVTGTAAGDKVKAIVSCEGEVKRFVIDPAFLEQEGPEMALDALVAATNTALKNANKLLDEHVQKATGVKLPTMGF